MKRRQDVISKHIRTVDLGHNVLVHQRGHVHCESLLYVSRLKSVSNRLKKDINSRRVSEKKLTSKGLILLMPWLLLLFGASKVHPQGFQTFIFLLLQHSFSLVLTLAL